MESPIPPRRLWFATIVTILVVIAVWKFIDWRMQPPPPTIDLKAAATAP